VCVYGPCQGVRVAPARVCVCVFVFVFVFVFVCVCVRVVCVCAYRISLLALSSHEVIDLPTALP
jgi:hypothetical protein